MKPVDLTQLRTKTDSSSSAGSAVINLVSTYFPGVTIFFQMGHLNSARKYFLHLIKLIIITSILEWNSLQVSTLLHYYSQLTRYLYKIGMKPVICSLQVDILYHKLQTSLQLCHVWTLHSPYFRLKPPWSYILYIDLANCRLLRVITGFFKHSGKSTFTYPSFSHRLDRICLLFQQNNQLSLNSYHTVALSDFIRPITIHHMLLLYPLSIKRRKIDDHGSSASSQASYTTFFGMNSSSLDNIQPYLDHIRALSYTTALTSLQRSSITTRYTHGVWPKQLVRSEPFYEIRRKPPWLSSQFISHEVVRLLSQVSHE